MKDCNGNDVPATGIYMVSEIRTREPRPGETWKVRDPTGHAEYYIDGQPVTQAEHAAALERLMAQRFRETT